MHDVFSFSNHHSIYRIGQTRAVRVVHLLMKDSLEERMVTKVQDGKSALGKGSMAKLKKEDRNKVCFFSSTAAVCDLSAWIVF